VRIPPAQFSLGQARLAVPSLPKSSTLAERCVRFARVSANRFG
jgi:hypothetical protein